MYSLTPFPDPNQDHFGFWIILATVIILVLCYIGIALVAYEDELKDRRPKSFVEIITWTNAHISIPVILLVLAIAAYNSWKPVPGPKNTQVIGTLVDSYETVELSGKRQTSPAMFIMYRVPEGEISFRRQTGVSYPKRVILYKW